MPPTHTLTGDRTHNLGMCPDLELSPQPFGVQDDVPTNLATRPGPQWLHFNLMASLKTLCPNIEYMEVYWGLGLQHVNLGRHSLHKTQCPSPFQGQHVFLYNRRHFRRALPIGNEFQGVPPLRSAQVHFEVFGGMREEEGAWPALRIIILAFLFCKSL